MACRSRILDFARQIWYVLLLVFLAARLWWQELWLAGRLRAGIFVNKAGYSSYADLVVWHATRRSFPSSSGVLPWRKAQEEISGAGSVNKCRFFLVRDLDAVMIPLAGHGGEGGGKPSRWFPDQEDAGDVHRCILEFITWQSGFAAMTLG